MIVCMMLYLFSEISMGILQSPANFMQPCKKNSIGSRCLHNIEYINIYMCVIRVNNRFMYKRH